MGSYRVAGTCCARLILATVSALAAFGCNARPQALPNVDLPFADKTGLQRPDAGINDYWPTFAHDYRRSGYNPAVTHLTRSNVSKLRLRWRQNVGDEIFASPVIYGANLIVVTEGAKGNGPGSIVYDFSASDGHLLWKFAMGAEAQMTPSIDPDAGLLIVAREQKRNRLTKPSVLFALRLLDGSVVWRLPMYAILRAAPVVVGGQVYIGRAGGDPPLCVQGGITAIDESTGKVEWNWNVDPHPNEGGSVWGAIAFDGSHLIFGTGNTCQTPIPTANGAVALSLDGKPAWNMVAIKDSYYDSDTGSGVMLLNGRAHFMNKNGLLYAVNQETGNIRWSTDLNPYARPPSWSGGFATPTTDGSTIVEGSGLYPDSSSKAGGEFCLITPTNSPEAFSGFYSKLQGMGLGGRVLWTRTMLIRVIGYVAVTRGLGFLGLNKGFVALDLSTGMTLWKYSTPNYIVASMIVVPSGVYGADESGNVYAFGLK